MGLPSRVYLQVLVLMTSLRLGIHQLFCMVWHMPTNSECRGHHSVDFYFVLPLPRIKYSACAFNKCPFCSPRQVPTQVTNPPSTSSSHLHLLLLEYDGTVFRSKPENIAALRGSRCLDASRSHAEVRGDNETTTGFRPHDALSHANVHSVLTRVAKPIWY